MKVALFGRTGFIGAHIANVLRQRHISFVGISRSHVSFDTIAVDWTNAQDFEHIPADVTAAIICSSKLPQKTYNLNDLREFVTSNVLGILNILEWAKRRNVSQLVYCSTLSMIPGENNDTELIDFQSHYPYKVSKAAAEYLFRGFCRENKMDHIVLRIASVYGPGMKPDFIHTMIQAVKTGTVFTLNDRSAEADLVYVDDVAIAAVESLHVKPAGLVINVTSGAPIKLIDLWSMIKEIMGNQHASIDIKGDTTRPSRRRSATSFEKLIDRPTMDLQLGVADLVKTYQ